MRLVPYGWMFAGEVQDLIERRAGPELSKFIVDPAEFVRAIAGVSPQPFHVLLESERVVGFARIDYGLHLPGYLPVPQPHDVITEDGYGMALIEAIESLYKSVDIDRYLLWIRADKPGWLDHARRTRGFEPVATIGWVNIPEGLGSVAVAEPPAYIPQEETVPELSLVGLFGGPDSGKR